MESTIRRQDPRSLSRRELLKRSVALGAGFVVGSGFVANSMATWAVETQHLESSTMATLIQMARDIYPHDNIEDKYYAIAVKGYDSTDQVAMVKQGMDELQTASKQAGFVSYMSAGWEKDRVAVLHSIEDGDFFQTIRSGLVTGLYNQKAVWPLFGYEGESFSRGGYLHHGFNDIDWL